MKMKKFFYLMAMVCSIGLLASCGGDDDDAGHQHQQYDAQHMERMEPG